MNDKATQNNEIIARFMGLEPEATLKGVTAYARKEQNPNMLSDIKTEFYEPNELKYHQSYDWLIPVVERLENQTGNGLVIYSEFCYWNAFGENTLQKEFTGANRLEFIYEAVIELIKTL